MATLFETPLCYGLLVWGNSSAGHTYKLLVLQNVSECCDVVHPGVCTVMYAYKKNLEELTEDVMTYSNDLHIHTTERTLLYKSVLHTFRYEEKPSYKGAKLF